jgi:hypothetical protein
LQFIKEQKLKILWGERYAATETGTEKGRAKGRVERREELVFLHMKRRCLRGAGSRTQGTSMEPTCRTAGLPLLTLLVAVVSLPSSSSLPLLTRMLEPGQYQFTGQHQGQYLHSGQHQGQYHYPGQHQYHPALHNYSTKSLRTFTGT